MDVQDFHFSASMLKALCKGFSGDDILGVVRIALSTVPASPPSSNQQKFFRFMFRPITNQCFQIEGDVSFPRPSYLIWIRSLALYEQISSEIAKPPAYFDS